ncbi:MAG: hypothetical protein IJ751_03835 [Oscillospiraceae bacterium]|nr:hypothetical protein [Oscillospiraceae bacterium]
MDREGNASRSELPCDTLVYAAGVHPDDALTRALQAVGIEAVSIGNCARLGRAIDAIRAATEVGLRF